VIKNVILLIYISILLDVTSKVPRLRTVGLISFSLLDFVEFLPLFTLKICVDNMCRRVEVFKDIELF